MPKDNFLIYGANGYTGRLITELASSKGLKPTIAGRNEEQIAALASQYGLEYLVFGLEKVDTIAQKIEPFKIVLHCAGPFSQTAAPMMSACLKAQVHYLDITGEIEVFEAAAALNDAAKDAGIVLMPGVGFDVVPSDCLASYLGSKLNSPTHLELAFKGGAGISQGTAKTMMENYHKGGAIRENGKIRKVPAAYEIKKINLGGKELTCATIPWGDVSTAFHSTGIPNIKVFTAVKEKGIKMMRMSNSLRWFFKMSLVQNYLRKKIEKSVKGPSEESRKTTQSHLWGKVSNETQSFEASLTTPEGYQLTAMTAIGATEHLLTQPVFSGFKTPSMAFGPDFILEFEGTIREDQ